MLSGVEIVALHGFLGLSDDWALLPSLRVRAIDLWPHARNGTSWSKGIGVEPKGSPGEARRADLTDNKPVLMGYSMGGRLAMQAALEEPDRWSALILVSAHPGLIEGREERLQSDQEWARRFRMPATSEPWSQLVRDWNSQPVLKSYGMQIERFEWAFDRESLACAMENWSLGRQKNLRADLALLPMPVLYVTGVNDRKFTELIGEIELPSHHAHATIEGAGHRVPWDQPQAFASAVQQFVSF